MALQLTKELESGVELNYWKITSIQLCDVTVCHVILGLYKDSAARQAGKAPGEIVQYSFNDSENPCTIAALDVDNPFILVYEKLKTLPEFTGAQDV